GGRGGDACYRRSRSREYNGRGRSHRRSSASAPSECSDQRFARCVFSAWPFFKFGNGACLQDGTNAQAKTRESKESGGEILIDERLEALSARGDPLEAIDHLVPWESFRADIEAVVLTPDELKKSSAGRKPFDAILMFRMLVLQAARTIVCRALDIPPVRPTDC